MVVCSLELALYGRANDGIERVMATKQRNSSTDAFDERLLDRTNRQILHELQLDARLSMAELGRRVGLSAPAVTERVQRLEQAGVIVGYRAEVDPRALGFSVAAVVRVRPAMGQLHRIPEIAEASEEVVECHRITGEDCYLLLVRLRSLDVLEEVLDRFALHGQTTTSIVHSSPVLRRVPLVPGEGKAAAAG
jgi:Lrp/AsnC family leucine-responsive transcriptional regulator